MREDSLSKFTSLSIVGISFFSAYILSFAFEGQVLYSLFEIFSLSSNTYISVAIASHFLGLFTSWLFIKSIVKAKFAILISLSISVIVTLPFYFNDSLLWFIGIIIIGYFSGTAITAWAHLLKAFTIKSERLKTSAKVLIYSNLLMLLANIVTVNFSAYFGLSLSIIYLLIAIWAIYSLPVNKTYNSKSIVDLKSTVLMKPLVILCVFIVIITINSGLMYQVFNPAFSHLSTLTSWYWPLPYIIIIFIMINLPKKWRRSIFLYVAITMMIMAFIAFMLLERRVIDYIIINTLLLGACGILDLFWWSVLAEMIDYSNNPSKVFGLGLSANVLGILLGKLIGYGITIFILSPSQLTVFALVIICITLIMLPALNNQLLLLFNSYFFLSYYDDKNQQQNKNRFTQVKPIEDLTKRETEVFQQLLLGKSNKAVANELFISENTVKTHARNIYSKYKVKDRVELMSLIINIQNKS